MHPVSIEGHRPEVPSGPHHLQEAVMQFPALTSVQLLQNAAIYAVKMQIILLTHKAIHVQGIIMS